MSTFTIIIRQHYPFQVDVNLSLSEPADDNFAEASENSWNTDNTAKDITKAERTLIFKGKVLNPPGSFWDTRRIFEANNIEQLLFEITLALDDSVEAQMNT